MRLWIIPIDSFSFIIVLTSIMWMKMHIFIYSWVICTRWLWQTFECLESQFFRSKLWLESGIFNQLCKHSLYMHTSSCFITKPIISPRFWVCTDLMLILFPKSICHIFIYSWNALLEEKKKNVLNLVTFPLFQYNLKQC